MFESINSEDIHVEEENEEKSVDQIELDAPEKTKGLTLEEAYQKAGVWGKFQTYLLVTLILSINSSGIFTWGFVFLELDPVMLCYFSSDPQTQVSCTYDQVCNNETNDVISWEVDYNSVFTIKNWIIQFELYCTPKTYIGMVGSITFVGAALACFVLPAAGDKYGRQFILQITNICQIPLYIGLIFAKSMTMIYFMCFYVGFLTIGRFICAFTLLSESVSEKYQSITGTSLLVGDTICILYLTVYYRFISQDSFPLLYLGLSLQILSVIMTCFIPESVKWLISMNQFKKAHESLRRIAKINGVDDLKITSFKIEDDFIMGVESDIDTKPNLSEVKSEEITQFDPNTYLTNKPVERVTFCSNKIILLNLFIMMCLWSVSSLDYYIISFFLKYVPGNIYVNATASTLSEIVATITAGFVYELFGQKKAFVLSFAISTTGGLLIAMIPNASTLWMAFFVLTAKFGISFAFTMVYLIMPQLFPTYLCGTAFGICNVVARFSTIFSPIIAELSSPMPMLIYSFSSIGAMVASLFIINSVKYD